MSGLIRSVCSKVQTGAMGMFLPPSPRHTSTTTAASGQVSKKQAMSDDEELKIKRIFNKYDKNGDGWISRGEWYDVVHKFLGDRDAAWILAEKIMDDLDVDPKDEQVTYSEFRAGMKSQWHLFKPKVDTVSTTK